MQIKYRFSINGHNVNPVYKDDLSKEYALEPQQKFYRAELSSKIRFMKNDYTWIMGHPFETEFVILMEKSNDGGLTWADYYTGSFFKTDCEIDQDTKKIEVKPNTKDDYTEVLAGLEKEYDLIKLSPGKTPLTIQKRPLIQVYIQGQDTVSCFLSGMSWEQEVFEPISNHSALINTYKFSLNTQLQKSLITPGTGMSPDVTGEYVNAFDFSDANMGHTWYSKDGEYKLTLTKTGEPGTAGTPYTYAIVRVSDDVVLFNWSHATSPYPVRNNELTLTAVSGSGATGTVKIYSTTILTYVRYLLDTETILGLDTYVLPANDIVENNRNYKRAIGVGVDLLTITNRTTTTSTEYGLADNGEYFMPPYSITGSKFYPIAKSKWGLSSVWFQFSNFDWLMEESGRKDYTLKDTTSIAEVIRVFLNVLDPGITHLGTSEYSQFLYGGTNPLTYNSFRLLLTQKSNILSGDYDQPAQKAPTTLSNILNMLRDTMQLYWYIDDGKFKIEHISWFKRGGSYTTAASISYDLTTLQQAKNKKVWGFVSSKYSYDKVDMPERYEFSWMDEVTEGFKGHPIEVNSRFIQRGKIENISISSFTTDIDYMMLNPEAISLDGFALFAATPNANRLGLDHPTFSYTQNTLTESSAVGTPFDSMKLSSTTRISSELIEINGDAWVELLDSTHRVFVVRFDSEGGFTGQYWGWASTSFRVHNAKKIAIIISKASGATITPSEISAVNIRITISSLPQYKLPYIQRYIDGADLRLQNGLLSFLYLHPNYWVDDLPSYDVTINDGEYTWVRGVQRKKKQKVAFPSVEDPNPLQLIKTYLGNGQIEKLSINLQSRMNDIELKYDTE